MAETTLAGYTQLPEGTVTVARKKSDLTAVRITGPFLVRGKNHVDYIEDGWLVQGEDGYLYGIEDVDLSTAGFLAPPDAFTDALVIMAAATAGTPYSETVSPPSNGEAAVTAATKTFGSLQSGLTLDASTLTAVVLAGTPGTPGGSAIPCYFEVTWTWDDGKSVVQRYALIINPAA